MLIRERGERGDDVCPLQRWSPTGGLGTERGEAPIRNDRPIQPIILRIAQSVEIAVSPSAVFALVCDPEAKVRLNPSVQVIRIEAEGAGPLREGSVTLFRLQKGRRIFEYRMRCLRLIPGRLLETRAELPTCFTVRVEVVPIPGGTRLAQQEECEIDLAMLEGLPVSPRAERAWRAMRLLTFVAPGLARETYAILLRERADALRVVLQRELGGWLEAIKRHLEAGPR
jgi:hypothetical protein